MCAISIFAKIYNLRYLSSAMLRENHAVFLGKKYRFPRGGGGINIRFGPKYRPLGTVLLYVLAKIYRTCM
jgi:hypothetical protein